MIFILVLQIAVAGLALANRDELKKIVEEGLRETVHRRGNDTLINNAWNDLEISVTTTTYKKEKFYDFNWTDNINIDVYIYLISFSWNVVEPMVLMIIKI